MAEFAIPIRLTSRGFARGEFTDLYGKAASIQESSLATEPALWLGCETELIHPTTGEKCGARMHLTPAMARELIRLLTVFVETGGLPAPAEVPHGPRPEIRAWLADISARYPIPELPPPAEVHPEFWAWRARWDAAVAFAEWCLAVNAAAEGVA